MAEQAEATFLKNFVGVIANQPLNYPDDFRAPPEQSLRKVPVLPVCSLAQWLQHTSILPISLIFWQLPLPEPPKREEVASTSTGQ